MKRAIITGANGFIGNAVTKKLLDSGAEVWAIVRDGARLAEIDSERLHVITASFEDYPRLPSLISERGFDGFFHFAWAGYGSQTNDIVVQTSNILQSVQAASAAAELKAARFIFADSSHEYLTARNECGENEFCSVYGAAKYGAQRMCKVICRNGGISFVGVLFTNIFGVGDRSSRSTNTFLRRLLIGQDLDLIKGDRLYDWTYIDDCVNGILAAAESGKSGKIYYVGSEKLKPFSDIIQEVRDILSPKSKLNFGVYQDNSYIDYRYIDIYELYRDTGYLPAFDFKEAVVRTANWLSSLDGKDQENKDV